MIALTLLFSVSLSFAKESPVKYSKEVDEYTTNEESWGEGLYRIVIAQNLEGFGLGKNLEKRYFQDGVPIRWVFQDRIDGIEVHWDHYGKVAKVCRNGQELLLNCSNQKLLLKENQFLMPQQFVLFEDNTTYFNPLWLATVLDNGIHFYIETGKLTLKDLQKEPVAIGAFGINSLEELAALKERLSFLGLYGTDVMYPGGKLLQHRIVFSFENTDLMDGDSSK
jgi:hypothetical protein